MSSNTWLNIWDKQFVVVYQTTSPLPINRNLLKIECLVQYFKWTCQCQTTEHPPSFLDNCNFAWFSLIFARFLLNSLTVSWLTLFEFLGFTWSSSKCIGLRVQIRCVTNVRFWQCFSFQQSWVVWLLVGQLLSTGHTSTHSECGLFCWILW